MTDFFKDLVNPRRLNNSIQVSGDFASITALYNARDRNLLEKNGLYRISWSGDDYAPDGEIITRWNGYQFYPNPLTQAEMPTWLFEAEDWNLTDPEGDATLSYDADNRPIMTKSNDTVAGTAYLYLDRRYQDAYNMMGANIRLQNLDSSTTFDRLGIGLILADTLYTYYSIAGTRGTSLVVVVNRYGSFNENTLAAQTWNSDESLYITQQWNQSSTSQMNFVIDLNTSGSVGSDRNNYRTLGPTKNNPGTRAYDHTSIPSYIIQHGDTSGGGTNHILTARTLSLSTWSQPRLYPASYDQPEISWTPAEITTTVWYDPSDFENRTIDSFAEYTGLTDKSGNGNDAIWDNGSVGTKLTVGWQNKLTTVETNAGNAYFSIPSGSFDTSPGKTYSLFWTFDTAGDSGYIVISTADPTKYIGVAKPSDTASATELGLDSTPEYWQNGEVLPSPQDRDQLYSSWNDGGVGLIKNIDPSTTFGDWRLFVYSSSSWWYSGEYGEIIIIDDDNLTTEIQQKIEGYLAWKWGYQSLLPNTHPYFGAPP